MSLASGATMMGRKQAEALMDSTCVIVRAAGADTVDPSTGAIVPGTPSIIYSGKCRLRVMTARARGDVVAAGQQVAVEMPILSLPVVGSEGVRANDVATVTTPLDAAIVVARVVAPNVQTHATARRFAVEVTS